MYSVFKNTSQHMDNLNYNSRLFIQGYQIVLYTGQYVQLFVYPFSYSQQCDYLSTFFSVSNNTWKYRMISLLSFLIKWNIRERKCSQCFSYLNKKDMIFLQQTAEFRLYFLSLLNIINLFDISFLAKSIFSYH